MNSMMITPKRWKLMRGQLAPNSRAETALRPVSLAGAVARPLALAPGVPPTPREDLVYRGGHIIADLAYLNVYVGGSSAWTDADRANIDRGLNAAMTHPGLNNVMAQYFFGRPVATTFVRSQIFGTGAPATVSAGDVRNFVSLLHRAGDFSSLSPRTTVVNFMLPAGTVLTDEEQQSSETAGLAPRRSATGRARGLPAREEASSLAGLGGYHGAVDLAGQRIYFAVGVYSEIMHDGKSNGIPVFDAPWKNVVATFYHELCEARTDPDVDEAIATGRTKNVIGWNSNAGEECGDFPIDEAGRSGDLRLVFKELAAPGGTIVPVQFQYSNAVHGPEGPIAAPHPAQSPHARGARGDAADPGDTPTRPMLHGKLERGLDHVDRVPAGFGRFGRMFPDLPPATYGTFAAGQALMVEIGETMIKRDDRGANIETAEPEDENGGEFGIPAGYTYFGQFIDHDITFDTASDLDQDLDPEGIQDFRTPRLDLDSLYGRGPDDQPYLYNSDPRTGITMKLGRAVTPPQQAFGARFDVPRAPGDASGERVDRSCERALIGDPRNDENAIVVQLHALFLRFHNKLQAVLAAPAGERTEPLPPARAFATTQDQVRWHYQWIVIHDFLRRIVGDETFDAVWNGGQPDLRFYHIDEAPFPFMPVEFSAAAYRFGHSMVRPSYSLSAVIPHDPALSGQLSLDRLAIFSPELRCNDVGSLNGFRPLIDRWGIDWSFFFPALPRPEGDAFKAFKLPQPAYRIDTLLVDPLSKLPDHAQQALPRRSLANLNLLRGLALRLPSGQAVARAMGISPLSDQDLWFAAGNLTDAAQTAARRKVFTDHSGVLSDNCPLWYYVLREAELTAQAQVDDVPQLLGGTHLGPVGGRIVAETIIGLIAADSRSVLKQIAVWQPSIPVAGGNREALQIADIIRFVDAST